MKAKELRQILRNYDPESEMVIAIKVNERWVFATEYQFLPTVESKGVNLSTFRITKTQYSKHFDKQMKAIRFAEVGKNGENPIPQNSDVISDDLEKNVGNS